MTTRCDLLTTREIAMPIAPQDLNAAVLPECVADTMGPADESAEVRQFCARHSIEKLAETARELVQRAFRPDRILMDLGADPEGDAEWLVIRAEVRGSVDEVLDRYSACKKEWVRVAPPAKLGLVRFVYNIL
jgi:hypothetical protein